MTAGSGLAGSWGGVAGGGVLLGDVGEFVGEEVLPGWVAGAVFAGPEEDVLPGGEGAGAEHVAELVGLGVSVQPDGAEVCVEGLSEPGADGAGQWLPGRGAADGLLYLGADLTGAAGGREAERWPPLRAGRARVAVRGGVGAGPAVAGSGRLWSGRCEAQAGGDLTGYLLGLPLVLVTGGAQAQAGLEPNATLKVHGNLSAAR